MAKHRIHRSRIASAYSGLDFSELAQAIVLQAVADWKGLCQGAPFPNQVKPSFEEIEAFFRSDWCALLMQSYSVSPDYVLKQLRRMRDEELP